MVGDFEHHLATLPQEGRRLVAFLGGTIGNFEPAERKRFLADLSDTLRPGDGLLLGTDLVKDDGRLVAAYNDAAGVTAEFNRNVLTVREPRAGRRLRPRPLRPRGVLGREAGVDRDAPARPTADQTVHVRRPRPRRSSSPRARRCAPRSAPSSAGPASPTELAAAGLRLDRWWTDAAGDFALSLSVRDMHRRAGRR